MIPLTVENLAALALQAGALALAGAPLPRLFGVRSPRARLAYWRALLLACLLLPAIQPLVPQTLRPVPDAGSLSEEVSAAAESAAEPASPSRAGVLPRVGVLNLVAAGAVARLAWFAFGLVTLGRLRRRSAALQPRPASVIDAIGLARADAEFRVASTPSRPVTFGLLRPVVVVPSDFGSFGDEEQKAIACHELVHVRRRDWARNIGDEVVRAIGWFHPAAWWLTRQIRLAREQVVDQEVVRHLGTRRPYLDALLRLASPDRGSVFVPAPLFFGRSHLADRVSLLLKEVRMSRPRLVLSFVAMAALLFLAGRAGVGAFPLHGDAIAVQQQPAGAATPGQVTPRPKAAPPVAATAGTKLKDVRPAFPAGSPEVPLVLRVEVLSSGAVAAAFPVEGPSDLADLAVGAVKRWKFSAGSERTFLLGFNPAASADLADQPPVLVGANVRTPAKVKDVKPIYPSEAQQAGVQGVVILETRIGVDGAVSDARVLRSIPLLDAAALQAVLRWKFTSPGFPLQMMVTVNFTLKDDSAVPSGAAGGIKGGVAGGVRGGVAGGMKGGVPGGLEGGVAGGVEEKVSWGQLPSGERAVRVGGSVRPPRKIVDVKPVYPQEALDVRMQGVVILEAVIGPDGKVKDAKVLRSIPLLDAAALEAVRQWEFTPTVIDGQPQSVIMTVTVNFTLQ